MLNMIRTLALNKKVPVYSDGNAWFADKKKWKTLAKTIIDSDAREYLTKIIVDDLAKGQPLTISVGTDSQQWGDRLTFATAIIVSREGRGSRGLYTTWHTQEMHLFPKLMHETQASILCAWGIQSITDAYDLPIEVHLDINPNKEAKSSIAMHECLGYVLGMGYKGILKPDASTTRCADHLLKTGAYHAAN